MLVDILHDVHRKNTREQSKAKQEGRAGSLRHHGVRTRGISTLIARDALYTPRASRRVRDESRAGQLEPGGVDDSALACIPDTCQMVANRPMDASWYVVVHATLYSKADAEERV